MNLIYIHTHDTGRYLQPYGYSLPTPRLQALAEESALFRNNYCCGPTCSPSRSAMLTGMHPQSCGMLGLAHRGFAIDYTKHLAQYLGRAGFETVLCGMQHEAADATTIGYERVYIADKAALKTATRWDEANVSSAIDFLQESHKRPFFLSCGLEHTHRPFTEFDADIRPDYLRPPESLPDLPETREDMAGFVASARRADSCIGKILDEVARLNLQEDTVILYTTDHGPAFPYMKCTLFDGGIGTAMMLRYPGNCSAGKAIDALTSHIDVFPTLCDLLGLAKPEWLQGRSLLPVLNGTAQEVNEEIFAGITYHAAYEPQRAVRTKRYKYIRRYGAEPITLMPANIDAGYSKESMMACGYDALEYPKEQLFDLMLDPNERNNCVQQAQFVDTLNEMRAKLQSFMEATKDPLLCGAVPLPKGAFANKPTCIDPDSKNTADYIYGK